MSTACWNLEIIISLITLIISCIISYQCKLWIVLAEFEISILHWWLPMLVRMSRVSISSIKSFRSIRIWGQFDWTYMILIIHYLTWKHNVLWILSHLNLIWIATRVLSVTCWSKCKSFSVLRIWFIFMKNAGTFNRILVVIGHLNTVTIFTWSFIKWLLLSTTIEVLSVLNRIHSLHLVHMLLMLHVLLLWLRRHMLLHLKHFLLSNLCICSTYLDYLSTIIWWFEELDIFHFLVISWLLLNLALICNPYLILTTPPFQVIIIQCFIAKDLHRWVFLCLFSKAIWIRLPFYRVWLLIILNLWLRCILIYLMAACTDSWLNLTVVINSNWSTC